MWLWLTCAASCPRLRLRLTPLAARHLQAYFGSAPAGGLAIHSDAAPEDGGEGGAWGGTWDEGGIGGGIDDDFATVVGMSACQWGEGKITCRLRAAGIPIAVLDAEATLCKSPRCKEIEPSVVCGD